MKKLLIIGSIGIIFTYEYVTEILSKMPDYKIDILSFSPRIDKYVDRENKLKELGCNIYYQPQYGKLKKSKLLHCFIRVSEFFRYRMCHKYDIINIHFVGTDSVFATIFAKKECRIISSVYGSDVLRANNRTLSIIKYLFKRTDKITVATDNLKSYISERLGEEYLPKIVIAKYGSTAAVYMGKVLKGLDVEESKKMFSFPTDKCVVLCGYNGSVSQKHIDIISKIGLMDDKLKNRIYVLCHCSYGGNENYVEQIRECIRKNNLSGSVLTDFLQGDSLARLRKSADVFINVQPSDVLSASQIEQMEAGTVCLIGGWLDYKELDDFGVYYETVDSFDSLLNVLSDVINNIRQKKEVSASRNSGVTKLLSWENQFDVWNKVLSGEDYFDKKN